MTRTDFTTAIGKISIMSEFQISIIFQFYDSLKMGKVHGNTIIEHLMMKDFTLVASSINLGNELIPYFFHKTL